MARKGRGDELRFVRNEGMSVETKGKEGAEHIQKERQEETTKGIEKEAKATKREVEGGNGRYSQADGRRQRKRKNDDRMGKRQTSKGAKGRTRLARPRDSRGKARASETGKGKRAKEGRSEEQENRGSQRPHRPTGDEERQKDDKKGETWASGEQTGQGLARETHKPHPRSRRGDGVTRGAPVIRVIRTASSHGGRKRQSTTYCYGSIGQDMHVVRLRAVSQGHVFRFPHTQGRCGARPGRDEGKNQHQKRTDTKAKSSAQHGVEKHGRAADDMS